MSGRCFTWQQTINTRTTSHRIDSFCRTYLYRLNVIKYDRNYYIPKPTRWIKEAIHIRKKGQWAMNREEGSYQLSHANDCFLGISTLCPQKNRAHILRPITFTNIDQYQCHLIELLVQHYLIIYHNKNTQLSLTNPRDVKPCQKLLQFEIKTSVWQLSFLFKLLVRIVVSTTLCSEKKHPLTFSFISPWVIRGFKQKLQWIYMRNGRFWQFRN